MLGFVGGVVINGFLPQAGSTAAAAAAAAASSSYSTTTSLRAGAIGRREQGGAAAASVSEYEGMSFGAAALASQALAAAAVCGFLRATHRQRPHQSTGRVTLRSRGWHHELTWRPKPGAKFRRRWSTDCNSPEWGHWPPEEEGRTIFASNLLFKGIAAGPREWAKTKANDEAMFNGQIDLLCGALLMDCDGTLVETERDGHRVAFNKAFKELGYNCEWEVDLYGELLTTGGGKERMTRYFNDYNPAAWPHEDPPAKDHPAIMELHKLKTKLFMEIVRSGELPLREGVEDLIQGAGEAGWQLAVCSTSNEESVRAVVETMLPKYAPYIRIFAGDVVKKKKPDPEIYLLAAQELGLAPMKCVVLEDTNIGCEAGKAASMQVIVTKSIYSEKEDFSKADIVVSNAAEVDFESQVSVLLPCVEFVS